jgi:hypothetical protein
MDSLRKLYRNSKSGFADIKTIENIDSIMFIIPINDSFNSYDLDLENIVENIVENIKEYTVIAETENNDQMSVISQLLDNSIIKIEWEERFNGFLGVTVKY